MYIEELDTPAAIRVDDPIDEPLPGDDPMDFLIEDLRNEFKRGLVHQAAQRVAARRKRLMAVTIVIAPVGMIFAAALIGRAAIHLRVETSRQAAPDGR